jgi:hypothetical protein
MLKMLDIRGCASALVIRTSGLRRNCSIKKKFAPAGPVLKPCLLKTLNRTFEFNKLFSLLKDSDLPFPFRPSARFYNF